MESNKNNANTHSHSNTYTNNNNYNTKKSALDYLVSILNYLRYIYKVTKIVHNCSSYLLTDNLKTTIKTVLIK